MTIKGFIQKTIRGFYCRDHFIVKGIDDCCIKTCCNMVNMVLTVQYNTNPDGIV